MITNTRLGRKTYVLHPSITPAFSVLDPDLTIGLPAYPTAACGFDVLTHAVEAFVSVRANACSDAIALEAILGVAGNLRSRDRRTGYRGSQMLLGSAMAAQAFNVAGLGSTLVPGTRYNTAQCRPWANPRDDAAPCNGVQHGGSGRKSTPRSLGSSRLQAQLRAPERLMPCCSCRLTSASTVLSPN